MLLGREAETTALEELVGRARAGAGTALIVRGEAGIGKTALLEHARVAAPDFTIVSTCGLQAESELPFAALADLVRPVLGSIAALPEPQAAALRGALALGPPAAAERFAIAAATLSVLAAAADHGAVLAVIDDAHWIDGASREALLFAARRLQSDPVAVLFALRDGETEAFEGAGVPELTVGPLDDEAAVRLVVETSGGRASPAVSAQVAGATGGNPLAIVEVTSPLRAEELSGDEALDPSTLAGTSVERAFLERAARLGADAQRALVVAAAGTSDTASEVEAACGLAGIDPAGLREAEHAGLLTRGQSFAFRHPLLRTAVYRDAGEETRRGAHAALAACVSVEGASERRAWHRASSAQWPDRDAAAELAGVAAAAHTRGALTSAAKAFERAAYLTPDDGERARWLFEAATAEQHAGDSSRALALLELAADAVSDPLLRADMERLRGEIEIWTGDTPSAARRLVLASAEVEPEDPRRAALLLGDAAFAALLSGDIPTGTELGRRALALAERVDPATQAVTAPVLANGLLLAAPDPEAMPLLLLYESLPLDELPAQALFRPFPPLTWVEEFGRARTLADHMISTGRAQSAPSMLVPGLFNLTEMAFRTGDWDEAYVAGAEAVSVARDASGQMLHLSLVLLARIEAGRGLEADCRAHAEEGLALGMELGDGSAVAYGLAALGLLELGLGDAGAAVALLEQLHGALHSMGVTNPAVVRSAPDLVEALVRAGRPQEAEAALAPLEAAKEGMDLVWSAAAAARCRGLLADDDAYEGCFEQALSVHARLPQPFEDGRTRLCFGERLRRSKRAGDARVQLRAAIDGFEAIGARPWAERARGELEATGERRRTRGPETAELTPRELQVALLVARGATNREAAAELFLTTKTIEFHLGQIYRKLGLRSRTDGFAHRLASTGALATDEAAPADRSASAPGAAPG